MVFFIVREKCFSTLNTINILIILLSAIITSLSHIFRKNITNYVIQSHHLSDAHFHIANWYEFNVESFFFSIFQKIASRQTVITHRITWLLNFSLFFFLIIIILFIWVRWSFIKFFEVYKLDLIVKIYDLDSRVHKTYNVASWAVLE